MGNSNNNTLAEIRARLAKAESEAQNNNNNFENNTFPFWNMKAGSQSVIRFLPDGSSENPFFWVLKYNIKLPFNGIKNGDAKQIFVNVPCTDLSRDKDGNIRSKFKGEEPNDFAQGCPILNEVRGWYKEKDQASTELANKYWKKPTYILQGFVRENAVADDKSPENPIRKFNLNKQLFNLVKAGLLDKDMENIPSDYKNGTDFKILSTTIGQYADYGTSSYSRKESSLAQAELDAVEKYGLVDLSDYLGKKPTPEDMEVIKEMFEASVNGEPYDVEKWGKHYRPGNLKLAGDSNTPNESSATVASKPVNSSVTPVVTPVQSSEPVVQESAQPAGKTNANDILAMIRAKRAAAASTTN